MKAAAAFISLATSLLWLGFVIKVVYDLHEFGAEMERLGRSCAQILAVPYTGKSCARLLAEERMR